MEYKLELTPAQEKGLEILLATNPDKATNKQEALEFYLTMACEMIIKQEYAKQLREKAQDLSLEEMAELVEIKPVELPEEVEEEKTEEVEEPQKEVAEEEK